MCVPGRPSFAERLLCAGLWRCDAMARPDPRLHVGRPGRTGTTRFPSRCKYVRRGLLGRTDHPCRGQHNNAGTRGRSDGQRERERLVNPARALARRDDHDHQRKKKMQLRGGPRQPEFATLQLSENTAKLSTGGWRENGEVRTAAVLVVVGRYFQQLRELGNKGNLRMNRGKGGGGRGRGMLLLLLPASFPNPTNSSPIPISLGEIIGIL